MGNAYPPQFLKKGKEKMFRDNLRLEEIYFSKLRGLIAALGKFQNGDNPEEIRVLLDSCIEANGAILLLYKNIGEAWNETTALLQEQARKLEELKTSLESFDAALNEKVDEINNYLNSQIGYLDARVTALENAPAGGGFTVLKMTPEDGAFSLYNGDEKITDYADLKALFDEGPVMLYYYQYDDFFDPPKLIMNYNMGFGSFGTFLVPVEDPNTNQISPDWVSGIHWIRSEVQDLSVSNPGYFSKIGYTVCYMSNASEISRFYIESDS